MNYYLTKYEKVRILGVRATHLSLGAPATVDTKGLTDVQEIAKKELEERKIPLVVVRKMPNGTTMEIPIREMEFDN